MAILKTIEVVMGGNLVRINEEDFNAEIHQMPGASPSSSTLVSDDITSVSVDEARSLVYAAQTMEELDTLGAAEAAGKSRKSVLKAIEERRAELAG